MIYGDNKNSFVVTNSGSNTTEILIPDNSSMLQASNLYFYCINNPANYIDQTGELAYPGQIHNIVVDRIAGKYGYHKEQTTNYDFGWGRADLISSDGRVWDVKRDKYNQINAGKAQVLKYTQNEWRNKPNISLSVGGYINPDSFVVTLNVDTYYIEYHYAGDGVIAYNYYKVTDWEKVADYAENALGIIIIAGCAYAGAQSGGSLAPALIPVAAQIAGG